ncbi:hypothetical protein MNAN1_002999 [Malassezia nana]|uniref:Inositol-pentakisphosphate 2-kinase n=1 Tax=Malassezia nana TaxID=180528 RepID=A0AAF0ESG1_9BASI|nr:hypothetical protein MNAN1_002999 [Malassezia nana]
MWPPSLHDAAWRIEDWHYVAEGAANVVVGYRGPAVWPFVDVQGSGATLALRLPKKMTDGANTTAYQNTPPTDVFIDRVLSHLLPRESLPFLRRIPLTSATQRFVQALAPKIESDRPDHRRAHSQIHVSSPYIWAMRDLSQATHPGGLVVEIKPKCGFLPNLPETAYPCKRHYSRYKMHRVYKFLKKHGTLPTYAECMQWYDPLDLFSHDADRVRRAVQALCREWAQGEGNMHVMMHGARASRQDVEAQVPWLRPDAAKGLADRVLTTLLQPHNQALITRLRELQQRFDPFNIEGLNTIWLRTWDFSLLDADELSMPLVSVEDYEHVALSFSSGPELGAHLRDWQPIVAAYLLSATLKDVSVFLPIQSEPHDTAPLHLSALLALCLGQVAAVDSPRVFSRATSSKTVDVSSKADQSNKAAMSEGVNYNATSVPKGARYRTLIIPGSNSHIGTFWSADENQKKAEHAFVIIHGRLRDGNRYWSIMLNAYQSALKDNYPGVKPNSVIVAPEFFSTKLNKGDYSKDTLAWDDVNAWQSGMVATHPSGTDVTSLDALDAIVEHFADKSKYPNMKNLTLVGHGGGGQLMNRYATIGKDPSNSNIYVRYIVGDPSSSAYYTDHRPVTDKSIAQKSSCPQYNDWRYGFAGFMGTRDGKKSPEDYFGQYVNRDVVNIVGYQDTATNGDQKCMALLQGGQKRRDRNLSWWRYINMLARTNENLHGFPGNFSLSDLPDWSSKSNGVIRTRLCVVENATHNADKVFGSDEGRSALFNYHNVDMGWRPKGWKYQAPKQKTARSNTSPSPSPSTSSPPRLAQRSSASVAFQPSGLAMVSVAILALFL